MWGACRKASASSIPCRSIMSASSVIDQNIAESAHLQEKTGCSSNGLCPVNLSKVLNPSMEAFNSAAINKRENHPATDTCCRLILDTGTAGNAKEMAGIYRMAPKDEFSSMLSQINSSIRHGRVDEAVSILININAVGPRPSIDVFNSVLGALVSEKRGFLEVVFVYKEMIKVGVVPMVDTLNYLLEALFNAGCVDLAMSQYGRMRNKRCSPNIRTFEVVMEGLVASNRIESSIIVLNEMLQLHLLPNSSCCRLMIPVLCNENKLEEGVELLKMMTASGSVPDPFVYETLIHHLCANLLLDEATSLLCEMAGNDLKPDGKIFADVVNGFCRLGKTHQAIQLLEENFALETMSIADCDSWNVVIYWFCRSLKMKNAYELVSRMTIRSIAPSHVTYSLLVVGKMNTCKYQDALRLFRQIRAKCWVLDPTSYSETIERLCATGMGEEALEVFCYMTERRCLLHPSSFSALIKCICEMGMVEEAIKLHFLAYNSGLLCETATYDSIMQGLSKFHSNEGLSHLMGFVSRRLIQGCDLDEDAHGILLQRMIAEDRGKECASILNAMVKMGFVPGSDVLYHLLLCVANHSRLVGILGSVEKLASSGGILDSRMCRVLVNGCWREGQKAAARRFLDLMLEEGWVPDPATHSLLLFGVAHAEEDEDSIVRDEVSDILAEGLTSTLE